LIKATLAGVETMKFLVRAVFAALGLWIADWLLRGVVINGALTLVIAALLLGVVNAFVRPVVFILTLPISIVTLGLFLLVVNAMMIGLVALLLPGMHVNGLLPGIGAAIITGVASWVGAMAIRDDRTS
jgi:putative membrane protein